MDVRESFSRLKKKLKRPGSKLTEPDRTGADSGGERADPASSLSRPVPYVVADGSHNREEGSNADGCQIRSTDGPTLPDVPDPVPICRSENDRAEGQGLGVAEEEASRIHLGPHSDIRVVVGSLPGREGNGADGGEVGRVHSSPSTPSISCIGKPDGA